MESYSYDPVHNRSSSGHQPGAWVYNADNQLMQWGQGAEQTTLTYTATGHTESETKDNRTRNYSYDAEERLVQVQDDGQTTASYQYDPYGRRIKNRTYAKRPQPRYPSLPYACTVSVGVPCWNRFA